MKKKITSLALVLALCLSLLPVTVFAEEEAEVPAEEPIRTHISTVAELQAFATEVNNGAYDGKTNAVVSLDADLDLTGVAWTPIGNENHDFAGTFDGQGHTISNITIGTADEPITGDIAGLFGVIEGTLKNLFLNKIAVNANAGYYVGGLAAYAAGPIENCHVVNLNMNAVAKGVGGLVGYETSANSIDGCSVSGEITAKSGCWSVGGFIGSMGRNAQITYSGADVMVTAPKERGTNVGGFIGKGNGDSNEKTVISNCYANGNVTGGAYIGGFAGGLWGLNIKNCYATGKVTQAAAAMASFVGTDASDPNCYGSVKNCYATGKVEGTAPNVYAFAMQDGTTRSPMTNCYYNNANIANSNETTTGKSLQEMQTQDFVTILNPDEATTNGWIYKANQTPLCGAEPADYRAVDAALGKIPADLTSYTSESVEVLNTAKASVVRGKVIAKQSEVDAMAKAIEDAIAALEKKPSSSSSGSSRPRYDVTTPSKPENGSVTVDPERARSGSRVTVTVTPDSGYKLGELVVTDKDGKKLELTDKGNGQYTFTMPSGKVEVAAEFVKEVEVSPFADVATDAYYYDAVKWAVEKGVTNGVSETLFGPDQACTRAQIVTFLWRAAGSPEPKSGSSFADVAADAYYAKAVAWAVENGITKGTSETTFHPDETCTRAQGVTFLYRALGKLAAAQAGFTDVAADSYYADAVNWAAENGVTNGISETLFGPDGSCTRAQIVTFLYRAYQGK